MVFVLVSVVVVVIHFSVHFNDYSGGGGGGGGGGDTFSVHINDIVGSTFSCMLLVVVVEIVNFYIIHDKRTLSLMIRYK
jgi:hypothetical protein